MANIKQSYKKQISNTFNYRATWAPSRPMTVGQIGKLQDGVFMPYTTLQDLGIPVQVNTKESEDTLDYSSSGGVSVNFKVAGDAVPAGATSLTQADAGIVIKFSRENALVFNIKGFTTIQLTNLAEVEEKILQLKEQGKWKKDYILICEVVKADSASIVISKSKNATLEISATADIAINDLKLSNSEANLAVVNKRDIGVNILAEQEITPLYKAMKVKNRFFRSDELILVKGLEEDKELLTTLDSYDESEFSEEEELIVSG